MGKLLDLPEGIAVTIGGKTYRGKGSCPEEYFPKKLNKKPPTDPPAGNQKPPAGGSGGDDEKGKG